MKTKVTLLDCSFCGKNQTHPEVEMLVTGPGVNICSECVVMCVTLIREHRESGRTRSLMVEKNPNYVGKICPKCGFTVDSLGCTNWDCHWEVYLEKTKSEKSSEPPKVTSVPCDCCDCHFSWDFIICCDRCRK